MSPAECFNLASYFKVSSDLLISQDTEGIDDGDGSASPFDHIIWIQIEVLLVGHRQDNSFGPLHRLLKVFFNHSLFQPLLVAEEPFPRTSGRWVGVLFLQFIPVIHIGVVDTDLGSHLGEFSHYQFAAAVTGVTHILPVAGAAQQHLRTGDVAAHVAQGVAGEFGHMQGTGIDDDG